MQMAKLRQDRNSSLGGGSRLSNHSGSVGSRGLTVDDEDERRLLRDHSKSQLEKNGQTGSNLSLFLNAQINASPVSAKKTSLAPNT